MTPELENRLNITLQEERVARYLAAAHSDGVSAIELYMWNIELAEAFQVSLHFAEIACRNAIHHALIFRAGEEWYNDRTFRNIIDGRFERQLDAAIADERDQHRGDMTHHHIVSALTFGFWGHLATKRFERYLWPRGISHNFSNAHYSKKPRDLNLLIESVRRWRNRVMHYRALFDKSPMRKHEDAIMLIEWVCVDTAKWVRKHSRVPKVINSRPKVGE